MDQSEVTLPVRIRPLTPDSGEATPMSNPRYSQEELKRYFSNPSARRAGSSTSGRTRGGLYRFFLRRFRNEDKAQAATALSLISGVLIVGTLFLGGWTLLIFDNLPEFEKLDNPDLQLATIAYTVDGKELARYAFQNRSWVKYEDISDHTVNALVATEDRRFHQHWGIDTRGILAAVVDMLRKGELRGASTISQQLARNLYDQEIGFEVSISRKLKEMVTAIRLEWRYTKREIIEMYLNTVSFSNNAYGIEAASRTYFDKPALELSPLEGATLIGMLKATTFYNPHRNPENARLRRNVVLRQMVRQGFLDLAFYEMHQEDPVETNYNPSAEVTATLAPYFAEQVRLWMRDWAQKNGHNLYTDGLRVFTPLDSRMQKLAQQAIDENMEGLQAVVDYEWSDRATTYHSWGTLEPYLQATGYEPWGNFWRRNPGLITASIRATQRYRSLVNQGDLSPYEAVERLRADEAFMDSLKTAKTRLQAGLVSIDPHNGHIKTWVGGRNLKTEWFDHVNKAARQPGSTFKPFTYTTAIDNGWSPHYQLPDSIFTYVDPVTKVVWQPRNSGNIITGRLMSLSEALARSKNTVTARVITQLVSPSAVASYARKMGITSPLDEVPALGLGTSDVTLLELTSAYGTLASGGLYHEPVFVTHIEDRHGNILYEHRTAEREALSQKTAYTMVDMLRGTINAPGGTAVRIRSQYGLGRYDLAGKTGTTQNSADGWFQLLHPQLVTGAWVGFNDQRVTFRTNFWGQGAHNAMFVVGDYFRSLVNSEEIDDLTEESFPYPVDVGMQYGPPPPGEEETPPNDAIDQGRRVQW